MLSDAVPWTGPVRVVSDRSGMDILGDPFTATYMVLDASEPPIILHHSANSTLANAIAAALNRNREPLPRSRPPHSI